MSGLQTTILIIHTLIALAIIGLVLMQRGKGAEAGAAFGAGASGTVFGARGSTNFFSRTTAILATAFFATSLALAYLSSQRGGAPDSILDTVPATQVEEQVIEAAPDDEEIPALQGLDSNQPASDDVDVPQIPVDDAAGDPETNE